MFILEKNADDESTRKGWYWYEKAAILLYESCGFENVSYEESDGRKEAVLVLVCEDFGKSWSMTKTKRAWSIYKDQGT